LHPSRNVRVKPLSQGGFGTVIWKMILS